MAADTSFLQEPLTSWSPLWSHSGDIAYTRREIPYVQNGNALQKLTLHIPFSALPSPSPSVTLADLRDASTDAKSPPLWLIYIHGGAWRDPSIDASSFDIAAARIFDADKPSPGKCSRIAGIACLNYTLSPHPHKPSTSAKQAEARNAVYPMHLFDVLNALQFLKREVLPPQTSVILAGHSCGAFLAAQVVMSTSLARSPELMLRISPDVVPPMTPGEIPPVVAIVLLNPLLSLPLMTSPPEGSEHDLLSEVYTEIVHGAFGPQPDFHEMVSPGNDAAREWAGRPWEEGRVVVLAQSGQDELVGMEQRDALIAGLGCTVPIEGGDGEEGRVQTFDGGRKVLVVERARGEHDSMWFNGEQIRDYVVRLLERLN